MTYVTATAFSSQATDYETQRLLRLDLQSHPQLHLQFALRHVCHQENDSRKHTE